jgi:hypothetical protein
VEYLRMQLIDLPPGALVAGAVFSVCLTVLTMMLLFAPRHDCFFFRWHPGTRLLALVFSPYLLILWPIVLVYLMMKHGIIPTDTDFCDD